MNPYEHAQQQQCGYGQQYNNATPAARIMALANCSLKQAENFLASVEADKRQKQCINDHFENARHVIRKLQNLGVTKQEIVSRLGLEEVTL